MRSLRFRQRALKRLLSGAAIALALCSCAQHEIEIHPEAFNRAIGSLDTRLLLLNAARASKNYPVEFTSVSGVLGGGKVSSELDPTIPLPFNSARSYDPGVKLSHERGFTQLNIASLNTKEAQEGLKKGISLLDVRFYALGGWPAGVVETLVFEEVKVHPEIQAIMDDMTARTCNNQRHPLCDALAYWNQVCSGHLRQPPTLFAGELVYRYFNRPDSKCGYARFQSIINQIGLASITILPQTLIVEEEVVDTGKVLLKKTKATIARFVASDDHLNDRLTHYSKILHRKGLGGIVIQTRSAERIVRYLGELIALQNYGDDKFIPKTVIDGQLVDLFVVTRAPTETGPIAVSVQDGEGDWFFVPTPSYGSTERHRTLQAMALVIDILNSAVSKAAIPQVQTVTLSAP